MRRSDKRQIEGWIAGGLSHVITYFWGSIENIHAGWCLESLLSNVGLMLVHCLSPMLLFLSVTLIELFWARVGAGLLSILALGGAWFLEGLTNPGTPLLSLSLIGLGALYGCGRPQPRKIAAILAVGLPRLTLIGSGTDPMLRVSQRLDDGKVQARLSMVTEYP